MMPSITPGVPQAREDFVLSSRAIWLL